MKITLGIAIITIMIGSMISNKSEAYGYIRQYQQQSAKRAVDNSCQQKLNEIRKKLQLNPRSQYLNWWYIRMQHRCNEEKRSRTLRRK